jgi:hypothetical protein
VPAHAMSDGVVGAEQASLARHRDHLAHDIDPTDSRPTATDVTLSRSSGLGVCAVHTAEVAMTTITLDGSQDKGGGRSVSARVTDAGVLVVEGQDLGPVSSPCSTSPSTSGP